MNIFVIPHKIYNYVRKKNFLTKFKQFDKSSGIGLKGWGDTCDIKGCERIQVGKNTWIGKDSEILVYSHHFDTPLNSSLTIGNHVRVTARCRITCAGEIVINDNVLIGPDVFITDHNHGMNPEIQNGYSEQPIIIVPILIGEGVWIGQRVCIMPGVVIGKHSIIGANSVVTHDIPDYSLAVGTPARVVKTWNKQLKKWERIL